MTRVADTPDQDPRGETNPWLLGALTDGGPGGKPDGDLREIAREADSPVEAAKCRYVHCHDDIPRLEADLEAAIADGEWPGDIRPRPTLEGQVVPTLEGQVVML